MGTDGLNARSSIQVGEKEYTIYRLGKVEEAGFGKIDRLPFSVRVLLDPAGHPFCLYLDHD